MTALEGFERGPQGSRATAGVLRGERGLGIDWVAPAICLIFGIACLVFIVGPGDATWILYAREMEAGHRIYSDLGLNQQPLFPLISLAGLELSPGGIIGDKILFFGVVGLHVLLIWLVSRRAAGPGLPGIILTFATYFTAIHFEAFRYDDYHAVAQCMVLGSLYLSMRYADGELRADRFALVQGALAAAAFLTRVNEGLAIAGAVAVLVLSLHRLSMLTGRLVLFSALGATAVFGVVLLLIGETPATWYHQTLVAASQAKGGSALAAAPWSAFVQALAVFLRPVGLILALLVAVIGFALVRVRPGTSHQSGRLGIAAGLCAFAVLEFCNPPDPLIPLTAIALVLSTVGFELWTIRWLGAIVKGHHGRESRNLALVFYPFFMFVTGALSTGGQVFGLYFPLALALVVGAGILCNPLLYKDQRSLRVGYYCLLSLLAVDAFLYRMRNPYSWLTYHVNPLPVDYRFENDPARGPHIITRELRQLVMPVCEHVGPGKSLLSLPYSFANYYCGIPVWNGYVQTFFDTSTRSRIEQLRTELERAPPDFIFYQRQLPILRMHEEIFAGGGRLPQRDLDELIVRKVRGGEWTIVYRSGTYSPSTWYLISTRRAPVPF